MFDIFFWYWLRSSFATNSVVLLTSSALKPTGCWMGLAVSSDFRIELTMRCEL
jgi:hypothetical protein